VSSVFWYAPFDNAAEMALAEELARHANLDLTVQSISERFGQPLRPEATLISPWFEISHPLPRNAEGATR
jgi:hypothetical protein